MKKKFPVFKTDTEAEAFVDTADLGEYDLSDMTPMRFELRRKDKPVSLRLPEKASGGGAQPRAAGRHALSAIHSHGDRARVAFRTKVSPACR